MTLTEMVCLGMDAFLDCINSFLDEKDGKYKADEFHLNIEHCYVYRAFGRDYMQITIKADPEEEGGPTLVQTTFARVEDEEWKLDFGIFCFDTYWTVFFKEGKVVQPS